MVVSLNSPTRLAVDLAWEWNITLIGYARGAKMHVYTNWQRISIPNSLVTARLDDQERVKVDFSSYGNVAMEVPG